MVATKARKPVEYVDGVSKGLWASVLIKSIRMGWPEGCRQAEARVGRKYASYAAKVQIFEDIYPAGSEIADVMYEAEKGQGIECEMYVPTGRWTRDALLDDMRKICTVHENMSRDEYLQSITRAKVALVTSDSESFATGCYEQVERGAIPVIRKRKWNRTWMTEDWPLVFTNTSEAAAMCQEAIKNYDSYRKLLEECMFRRWGNDLNFGTVMQEVWDDYIISADREFSVDKLKISSS